MIINSGRKAIEKVKVLFNLELFSFNKIRGIFFDATHQTKFYEKDHLSFDCGHCFFNFSF